MNAEDQAKFKIGDKVKLLVCPRCIGEVIEIEEEVVGAGENLEYREILHLRSPQPYGHVVVDGKDVKRLRDERFEELAEKERRYFRGGFDIRSSYPPVIDKYL